MTTIKHIESNVEKSHGRSGGDHACDLMSYFEKAGDDERVVFKGFRNLPLSRDWERASFEMSAIADSNPRVKNSMYHLVLSWSEGEEPTLEQVEEALDLITARLGAEGLACGWAVHGDTQNRHLHVAYCRTDMQTGKARVFNKGFDRIALHQASALIDVKQGWARPENSIFGVSEIGDTVHLRSRDDDRSQVKVPVKIRDAEVHTGTKSALRIAQEMGGEILRSSSSWRDLHDRLAAFDMAYEIKGSGAVIRVGDQRVKASQVDRKAALAAMVRRLGEYEPPVASPGQVAAVHARSAPSLVQPLNDAAAALGWSVYRREREEFFSTKREMSARITTQFAAERRALFEKQAADRREISAHDWRRHGALMNALRQQVAFEHAKSKAALLDRQKQQRRKARLGQFPSFEEWVSQHHGHAAADLYRHPTYLILITGPQTEPEPGPVGDIRDYRAEIFGSTVRYIDRDGNTAFIDTGPKIAVIDTSDEGTLAALQLAQQRYGGGINMRGSDEWIERAIRIAVENRITISNPELQDAIAAEQQRRRQYLPVPGTANTVNTVKPSRLR